MTGRRLLYIPSTCLPVILTLLAAPIHAASPILGPEVAVSAPVAVASSHFITGVVSVASKGDLALAVWGESRGAQGDVYGMRVDVTGNPLDEYAIRITSSPVLDERPRVVWNGGEFVVVWQSATSGSPTVWMRTVATDGGLGTPVSVTRGVLEDAAIAFGVLAIAVRASANTSAADVHFLESGRKIAQIALAKSASTVRLTATGSGFAAAWMTSAAGFVEVHAARFSAWGALEDPDVLLGSERAPNSWGFDLAARGDDVFFALGGSARTTLIRWTRLKSPHLVGTLPQRGSVGDLYIDGDRLLVVVADILWQLSSANGGLEAAKSLESSTAAIANLGGRPWTVSLSRFSVPRSVLGEFFDTTPVLLSRAPVSQTTPVIASDGERLLIAWYESTRVVGVLAARDGRPLGAPFEIFPAREGAHRLAAIFAGGEYIVFRQERGEAIFLDNLIATHITRDGVPRHDRVLVSNTANALYGEISTATDGTNVLVAWSGGDASLPRSRYTILTASGPGNIYELGNSDPMVAWNGSIYVAVDSGTITIVRIASDGRQLSRQTLSGVYGTSVTIASDGNGFLVSYVRIGLDQGDMLAFPLDRDGQPAGTPVLIERNGEGAPPTTDDAVANVWNGRTFDLAWASRGRRLTGDAKTSSRFDLGEIATPVLFGLGGGDSIVAYARPVDELGGSFRVFTRLLMQPRTRPVRR